MCVCTHERACVRVLFTLCGPAMPSLVFTNNLTPPSSTRVGGDRPAESPGGALKGMVLTSLTRWRFICRRMLAIKEVGQFLHAPHAAHASSALMESVGVLLKRHRTREHEIEIRFQCLCRGSAMRGLRVWIVTATFRRLTLSASRLH